MLSYNRITKSVSPKTLISDLKNFVDSTVSFNQGDLLVIDATNHLVKAMATGETGSKVIGISQVSIASGKPIAPYQGTDVDAAVGIPSLAGPLYGVEVKLVLKTSDAANPGDLVYPNPTAGTHHVTTTAGSLVAIGIYQGPAVASAVAGQEIVCLLGANGIVGNLSF